jgi:PilZ domain
MGHNRRRAARHSVGFYVEQFVNDEPQRCFTTDLSSIGLYMERLVEPMQRSSNVVQLEIKLPTTDDSIWASGEVVYDRIDSLFHGTAIRFTNMARTHQRWLREWLRESERVERFASTQHPLRSASTVRVHRPRRLPMARLAA